MTPLHISDRCTIYNGDALAVLSQLPQSSVDAVITDPPYCSGGTSPASRQADPADKYQSGGTKKTYPPMIGDSKDQRSWTLWCTYWLSDCLRIAKDGAPLLAFSDWRQLPSMTDAVQAAGWIWRGVVVWDKPSARPIPGRFRHQCEYIVFATKGRFAPVGTQCLPGVFRHHVNAAQKVHLTSKPVPLIEDLLAVTPQRAKILDPFMGGGTTGVAALGTGREFVGVELSEEYFEIARNRLPADLD